MDWKNAAATEEICTSNHVLKLDVARAVKMGLRDGEQVAGATGACYQPGCCKETLDEMIPFFVATMDKMRVMASQSGGCCCSGGKC